jgi:hypothetical protein
MYTRNTHCQEPTAPNKHLEPFWCCSWKMNVARAWCDKQINCAVKINKTAHTNILLNTTRSFPNINVCARSICTDAQVVLCVGFFFPNIRVQYSIGKHWIVVSAPLFFVSTHIVVQFRIDAHISTDHAASLSEPHSLLEGGRPVHQRTARTCHKHGYQKSGGSPFRSPCLHRTL